MMRTKLMVVVMMLLGVFFNLQVEATELKTIETITYSFDLEDYVEDCSENSDIDIIALKSVGGEAYRTMSFLDTLNDTFYINSYVDSIYQSSPHINKIERGKDGLVTVTFNLNILKEDIFASDYIFGKNFLSYYEMIFESTQDENLAFTHTNEFYRSIFNQDISIENMELLNEVYTIPLAIKSKNDFKLITIPYFK